MEKKAGSSRLFLRTPCVEMKLPHFVPILTAFTARVAGREIAQLLQSPTTLARALAETQIVVGHDGVLCFYAPSLLLSACIRDAEGIGLADDTNGVVLISPDEILQTAPIRILLESIQPLRHQLPDSAAVFATFTGPGLLYSQMQSAFETSGLSDEVDPDYVLAVIRNVVRSALELKADGIALIERTMPTTPSKVLRAHKAVRKLADFYDAGFLVFKLPDSDEKNFPNTAHCVFDLATPTSGIGPVTAYAEQPASPELLLLTTAGDVAANTTVEELRSLTRAAHSG
jgi:hypothetical protein